MKILLRNHNNIFDRIKDHFELVDNIDDAEAVVVWQDIMGMERDLVLEAKAKGIPTIVFEHGYNAHSDYRSPRNYPLIADYFGAWGDWTKRRMIEAGIDESRIIVTGTTIYDELGPIFPHSGINVLFAPLHWEFEIEENLNVVKELWKLTDMYNITTKLIEGQNPDYYIKPIVSQRNTERHLTACWAALTGTDVVVSIREGTFETIAHKMGIPVVIVTDWEPKPLLGIVLEDSNDHISDIPVKTTLDNLQQGIEEALNRPLGLLKRREFYKDRLGASSDGPQVKMINAILSLKRSKQ